MMRSPTRFAPATAVVAGLVLGGCAEKLERSGRKPMKLDICGERTLVDPSDADIRSALGALDAGSGDAFLVLGATEMTYIQASGHRKRGFDLEYQDGSTDRHFRATNENFTIDDVAELLIAYRNGDYGWKGKFAFERVTW